MDCYYPVVEVVVEGELDRFVVEQLVVEQRAVGRIGHEAVEELEAAGQREHMIEAEVLGVAERLGHMTGVEELEAVVELGLHKVVEAEVGVLEVVERVVEEHTMFGVEFRWVVEVIVERVVQFHRIQGRHRFQPLERI